MINKRLLNLCSKSKRYIILTVAVKWIALICNIGVIFTLGYVIDAIVTSKGINLFLAVIIVAIMLCIRFVCNYLVSRYSHMASQNAKTTLRSMIYDKLMLLGTTYTRYTGTASVIQITGEGIESLENYFGKYIPQIFYSMLAPITLFTCLSFISVKTALVLLICVPLIPVSIIAFMKIAKKLMKNYWGKYSDLGETFLENLQGLTTLKLFKADGIRHNKINSKAEHFRKITMKVLSMQLNSITIMDVIAYGGAAIGSIIALLEYRSGAMTIGHLMVIILLSAEFFLPLRMLGSFFHIAMTGIAASEKIFELLDVDKEENKNALDITSINKISFDNVQFCYEKNNNVLNNISFEVNKNEFIAFAGESGSGKSTIAALIMKMQKAKSISINSIDINDIHSSDLMSCVNLLSTDAHIFNTTIRENLLVAKHDATNEQMIEALKMAQLYEFVCSLPDGVDTKTGENASLLSGGQKQRLALARTILSNRQVLIFDEATSNIDSESEKLIWQSINKLKGKKTIIAISHRLANIKNADCIYMLSNGEIVEQGSHDKLIEKKGIYYSMLKKQSELESMREVAS
jgi:ATP-binding cassette subfamily C protein